eukprot:TRINITY_DN162876_c0_g2_i1.p1 TRINITY_DN162876_c0_g2~~TRINITY_DN162876_c0_g2_i1.p1  ORF type:complete len:284 (+),score=86.89 TRINITY_DN162876_c0_g2_i1:150-1001(+)
MTRDEDVPLKPLENGSRSKRIIGSEEYKLCLKKFEELFVSRPIWSRSMLVAQVTFTKQVIEEALSQIAYYITGGPWRNTWCRFGVDPRIESSCYQYQTIDVRLPEILADKLKNAISTSSVQKAVPRRMPKSQQSGSIPSTTGGSSTSMQENSIPKLQLKQDMQICDLDESLRTIAAEECTTKILDKTGYLPLKTIQKLRMALKQKVVEDAGFTFKEADHSDRPVRRRRPRNKKASSGGDGKEKANNPDLVDFFAKEDDTPKGPTDENVPMFIPGFDDEGDMDI